MKNRIKYTLVVLTTLRLRLVLNLNRILYPFMSLKKHLSTKLVWMQLW